LRVGFPSTGVRKHRNEKRENGTENYSLNSGTQRYFTTRRQGTKLTGGQQGDPDKPDGPIKKEDIVQTEGVQDKEAEWWGGRGLPDKGTLITGGKEIKKGRGSNPKKKKSMDQDWSQVRKNMARGRTEATAKV